MVWKIAILLVFASLASCDSDGIAFVSVSAGADVCTKLGPQCSSDRKEVIICSELGKPGKVVKSCEKEGGKRCSESQDSVKCVEATPNDDKPVKFSCSAAGEYPDPLDCQHTYKCKAGKEYPTEKCHCAKGGYVYPDKSKNHPCFGLEECPRQEIKCEEGKFGEFTVNGEGTGVCYYCKGKDTSTSFKCGNVTNRATGLPENKICVKLEEPPTTTPPPPTSKPPEQKPVCTRPGELHSTECDCDYYECDHKLVVVRRTCKDGMLWYEKFKTCIYGECEPKNCIYRDK